MPASNSIFPSYSAEQRQAEPPPLPSDWEPVPQKRTLPDIDLPISAAITEDEEDDDLAIAGMVARNINQTMSRVGSMIGSRGPGLYALNGQFRGQPRTAPMPINTAPPGTMPHYENRPNYGDWPEEVEESPSPFQGFGGRPSGMRGSALGGYTAPTPIGEPLVPRGMQGSSLDRPPGNQPVQARWDRGTPTVGNATERYYQRAANRAQAGSRSDARRVRRLSYRFNVDE